MTENAAETAPQRAATGRGGGHTSGMDPHPPPRRPWPSGEGVTVDGQTDLFAANGANAAIFADARKPTAECSFFTNGGRGEMTEAEAACAFLEALRIPAGPRAGEPLRLAAFQRQFVHGALAPGVTAGVLSVGRGNAKSALSAGIALGALVGAFDDQPSREIVVAARTREQGQAVYNFAAALSESLPLEIQRRMIFRRAPRLEIELDTGRVGHMLKVLPADARTVVGGAPTLAVMDERGMWEKGKGDELEAALLSGLVKRGGRALIISTSAPDDTHAFSRWLDEPPPGAYVQEHRPPPGLPADDRESLLMANPGALAGMLRIEDLEESARQAIARGGSALQLFRLWNRNERVSGETRDLLLLPDQWLACEAEALPPRSGPVVVGVDLGGSASMTGAAYYWFETGRLEARGFFPSVPNLLDRGQADGVAGRYVQMAARGELETMGERTVPVAPCLTEIMEHVRGETVAALTADRYKAAELTEALDRAGIRVPVAWRGQGFRDGGEDVDRFRRAAFDGGVRSAPSLLLRSAFADAVTLSDPAGNAKLAKARSKGRIDAAAAAVLAVAEGARIAARPRQKARFTWA